MFSLLSRGLPLTTLPRVSYVRHKKSRMQACCIGFLRNETAQGASPATTENAYDLPEPVFLTARPVSGAQSCLLRQESGGFAAFFTPQCRISFRPSSGHAPHELPAHSRNLVFHRISCASAFQVYHNRGIFSSVFRKNPGFVMENFHNVNPSILAVFHKVRGKRIRYGLLYYLYIPQPVCGSAKL